MSLKDSVAAIVRHISGDKAGGTEPDDMVAGDAIKHGGARDKASGEESSPTVRDSAPESGKGETVIGGKSSLNDDANDDQTHCGQCNNEFGSKATKGKYKTKEIQCDFCGVWQCGACTKFKTADLALLQRNDLFYACMSCQSAFSNMSIRKVFGNLINTANKHTPANTDAATEARFSALESKMCKFDLMESKLDAILDKLPASDSVSGLNNVETKIDSIINQIPSDDFNEQVKTIKESLEKTNENVSEIKVMYSKAVGDNPNAKVTYSPEQTRDWITQTSKKVAREIKIEEKRNESRLNNIIILGAPEKENPDHANRKNGEKAFVEELLATLEINEVPEKMFRLGNYSKKGSTTNEANNKPEQSNSENDSNQSNSKSSVGRPIKVVFKSQEVVNKIMENATKLASAPPHLKGLSIGYDMSTDERKVLKEKLSEAHEKNSKNPTFVHKVKGPPWNLQIVRFKKRD